jgi:type I restriction enzyme, S subunit
MNQSSTAITNSQLKEGYKQTEVGVIPEDWEVATATKVCEIIIDCKNRTPPVIEGGEFAVVRTPNVRNGRFVYDDLRFTDESSFHEWTARAIPQIGDILITREAPLGEVCLVPKELKVCLGQRMMLYRPDQSKIDSAFFLYSLMAPIVQRCLLKKIGGSTVGHAKVDDIRNVSIPLPPTKAEQEAIACTLSDIDALIESLDRLLTKKRQIKQGAMQELLRSKDGWVEKKLSEIAEIRSGGTPSTSRYEFWDGDILWCTPTDITALKGYKYLVNTSRLITSQGLSSSSAEMIPANSVVMTSRATIGECAINKIPVSTNQGFKNFIPFDETNVEFLYYLLQTQKQRFISLCGGSTFLEIGKNQLSEFLIELPPLLEQIEIADILSDMDAEIGSIESKLTKTRQLKQGMMHELLTGRIRLVDYSQGKR